MKRALDTPATQAALRRYRRRSAAMLGGAVVLFFAAGALLGLGLFGLAASMTMRRALRRHAWQSYSCRFRELPTGVTPNGTPVLVLDEKHTVTISSVAWRWRALNACDGGEVWFAGDPESHGVAAPPGGLHLLAARAPRWRRRRERLREQVLMATPARP